ncbi:hypothetical protein QHG78_22820 [Bacteroides sp. A1-P5]|uniref:Uncharacterized protein n=2 Tax=Bacteroides TaxID=816 RepID=A0ABU5HY64_9BACE|nr:MULTISPECIES: hypothetical protein [unclassified Bacteroides]MDY7256094.1 hypothetical protein [Bacteroides sp. A1-P5]MDY7260543.1 hypothetical protein [Bacteroides sp. A2-P53]
MNNIENLLGCYVSYPSLMYDATEIQKQKAREEGDLFSIYIWGNEGISDTLKKLKYENYGNDMNLILLEFYVNPIPYLRQNLKEIESYRKKEKAIGIPIIVTDENFFSKTEEARYRFLKEAILNKMDLLENVVKKKKLDTDVKKLKADIDRILQL